MSKNSEYLIARDVTANADVVLRSTIMNGIEIYISVGELKGKSLIQFIAELQAGDCDKDIKS